jgi:hypothetical protein
MRLRTRVLIAAALFLFPTGSATAETYDPSDLSAVQVFEHARAARGSLENGTYKQIQHLHVGGVDRTSTTYLSGKDWRTTVEGGGYTEAYGFYQGKHWRQNDNGIVVLQSDFRAKVDPNVLALDHPEDPHYRVRALGLTQSEPREYVVEANPPAGSDQYRYYNAKTFLLDRVVTFTKDRYRHVTEYGDYRPVFGETLAFRVHSYDGRPQNDDLTTTISVEKTTQEISLALPPSRPLFQITGDTPIVLPARFTPSGIILRAVVNGRGLDFLLDSGASALFIDPGVAHDLGLTPYGRLSTTVGGGDVDEGRVRIPEMSIGTLALHDVVLFTTPHNVQTDGARIIGLIGFDLLASAVTEIDFKAKTVTVYPRTAFNPDALGLRALPLELDDGIPRVMASIEHVPGAFLLDTGAFAMLAYRNYVDKLPAAPIESLNYRIGTVGGPMDAQLHDVTDFEFAGVDFRTAQIIVPNRSTFDITDYDAIIGRNALSDYRIYFDYANRTLYVKPNL